MQPSLRPARTKTRQRTPSADTESHAEYPTLRSDRPWVRQAASTPERAVFARCGGVLRWLSAAAVCPGREPAGGAFGGRPVSFGNCPQSRRDHSWVDKAGPEQLGNEVLVFLSQRAQFRDAEVFLVEALAGELRSSAESGRVGVLDLDQPVQPAFRQRGCRQVGAASLIRRRNNLRGCTACPDSVQPASRPAGVMEVLKLFGVRGPVDLIGNLRNRAGQ